MEVKAGYAWNCSEKEMKNDVLLPRSIRGLVIGKGNCGKTTLLLNLVLQPNWLDYNHLYTFGRSLHQMEYKILHIDLKIRLSKEQIGNIFKRNCELKHFGEPLNLIDTYVQMDGVTSRNIKASFYEDNKLIHDPSELNVEE